MELTKQQEEVLTRITEEMMRRRIDPEEFIKIPISAPLLRKVVDGEMSEETFLENLEKMRILNGDRLNLNIEAEKLKMAQQSVIYLDQARVFCQTHIFAGLSMQQRKSKAGKILICRRAERILPQLSQMVPDEKLRSLVEEALNQILGTKKPRT